MSPKEAKRVDRGPLSYDSRGDESFDCEEVGTELSLETCEELLNPGEWGETLGAYARTCGLAVALTDCEGRQSGECHNAQPLWLLAGETKNKAGTGSRNACPFCLEPTEPCQAVTIALAEGRVGMTRDGAGLVHLAVPLFLGKHQLGALIAGQVFDQYPESLPLQWLARTLGISTQEFLGRARLQQPIRNATLQIYGKLLLALGKAFVRQRYATILNRALARASLRMRLLLEGAEGHAFFTVDGTGGVTSWNSGAERIFGHTEADILGQDFSLLFTPEDISAGVPGKLLVHAEEEGRSIDRNWQVRKDGTRFCSEGSLAVLGKDGSREFGRLTHDVTERRNAEEALRQSQKLESIGVLASGIAHDFNNLLTGITGGISFALSSVPKRDPAYELLVLAEKAAQKAADLTHQLLAYGGKGQFVVTRFDLSVLIQDMLELLQTSIPRAVRLDLELETGLPWIEADASQIQQIVMNLVINGAESIGPEGGSLRVSTARVPAEKPTEGHTHSSICMEVQDTGSGMTDETKARIFDPFFTTKFTGRGLGLAAVSGIVRGHHGTLEVESVIGVGTTFRICFPGVEKPAEQPKKPARAKDVPDSGTVLVVDDEPILLKMALMVLEHFGYKVLGATNGREAVEVFRENADTIRVVLLDLTMPVMNGVEALRQIREIRSDVPVVISTGYSEATAWELLESGTVAGFLQKPYTPKQLRAEIGAVSQAARPM